MAFVFGNAITDSTLMEVAEFQGKKITHQDKARVALRLKHSEEKDVMVRQHVEKLMEIANDESKAFIPVREKFTVCLIYNATGDTLSLVTYHDWNYCHIGFTPYPPFIENGQWGVFLHIGSTGAVVYRGKNKDYEDCDWMQAWDNGRRDMAYCEIREVGHWKFENDPVWEDVNRKMSKSSCMNIGTSRGGYSINGTFMVLFCDFFNGFLYVDD